MKLFIISVRDSAGDVHAHFQAIQNKGQFLRQFADEVNRPAEDNMLYKHAADYEAFCLGEFDNETGVISPYESPQSLGRAVDFQAAPGQLREVK